MQNIFKDYFSFLYQLDIFYLFVICCFNSEAYGLSKHASVVVT